MATGRLAAQLGSSMLDQNDPETVRVGAPAYLLLVDSLIAESPNDDSLLIAGAELYGAYAGALVEDPERRRRLTERSLAYASRALCDGVKALCAARDGPIGPFEEALARVGTNDLAALYSFGTGWVGWLEAHSDDWNALAQVPKAELVFRRIVELDPGYHKGRAQLYLAALLSLGPASAGGKLDEARSRYEQAILYSDGRDLIVKVEYARRYARLMFDRPLHDRLLREVLKADATQPGLTLSNVLAQQEAERLLAEEFF